VSNYESLEDALTFLAALVWRVPAWFFYWWLAGAGLAVMANWWMGQDLNYDLLNYHVYGAYSLLSGRLFGSVDIPGQFIANPLPWVPYLVLTRLLQPVAGTSVIAAVQGINLPLTIAVMATLIGDPWPRLPNFGAAIATAVLVAAAPVSRSLVGTSFADLTYAPLVLGGCLLLLHAGGPGPKSCWSARVVWAGLLLGSAFGLKFTAGPYALAGAAAVAIGWQGWRSRLISLLWLAIGGVTGAAATGGWWAIFTWQRYRSPVYPFFNAIFRSPFAPAVNWRETDFLPQSATDVLLLPWRWATDSFPSVVPFHGLHILLVVLLAVVCLVATGWRRARAANQFMPSIPARRFTAFMAAGGAAWLFVFAIERYAVPLELLTAPAIVAMVWRLVGGRLRLAVLVVLITPALAWSRTPAFGRITWRESWFGVTLPRELRDQPATYVGMGPTQAPEFCPYQAPGFPAPTGFLVQFFPRGSRFVSLWLGNWGAPGWEPAQRAALSAPLLRTIFCNYPSAQQRAKLLQFGLTLATPCWEFGTYIGPVTVCSVRRGSTGADAAAAYTLGKAVSFAAGGDAPAYMLDGWWPSEWFTWAVGTEATLALRLPADIGEEHLLLRARVIPANFASHLLSEVTVRANGREVARWRMEGSQREAREYTACIPAGTVTSDGHLRMVFVNPSPVSPAELGISADPRRLALGLQSFEMGSGRGGC
jgi:hypothetical protein